MQLLISVLDGAEAAAAAAGGADIIDVKDPAAGALGAASTSMLRAVGGSIPPHLPLSAALGDRPGGPGSVELAARNAAGCGADFVKIGLLDTGDGDAVAALRAVKLAVADFAPPVRVIAVGFADFARAGSPAPLSLPHIAKEAGVDGCLLDTAIKDGQGLFAWLDDEALRSFVATCREFGLLSALAGSLAAEDVPRIAALRPDVVGFRGAACAGDRVSGRVTQEKVAALRRALDAQTISVPLVVPTASSLSSRAG
jgi:uncharacterized protein (UPF0264 family)